MRNQNNLINLKLMCKSLIQQNKCEKECPFWNFEYGCGLSIPANYPKDINEKIDKFYKSHTIKTYSSDFINKHPDAELDNDGIPVVSCELVYGKDTSWDDIFIEV